MKRKILLLFLLLFCFTFTLSLSAQNFTTHNWLFSNNDQGIHFGKELGSEPIVESGKIPLSNIGEKLSVSDPTTGELLFYSDGTNIYDASHSIMLGNVGLSFNLNAIQGMAASPIPGIANDSSFYVFTRDNTGEIFYTTVNMNAQGNRANGPSLGEVISGESNQATGITNRGDGMITIGSRDMASFWLVTQNATNGAFEVFSIDEGGGFTARGTSAFSAQVDAMHLSYNSTTSRIAIVPSNDVNIQVLRFNEGTQELSPELEFGVPNSFALNETFGGAVGWSPNGTRLFFSRNGAADGNVYRYDFTAPLATVLPILTTNVPESLSLMVAPDSAVYHLYRATTGGDRILGRILNTDFILDSLSYESDVFIGQDFASNYFQQFLPEKALSPTVDFVFQEPCLNNPTLFLPIIIPPEAEPTAYNWDFQGAGQSNGQRAPIVTFDQAGMISARLTVEINGVNIQSPVQMITIEENDLEVQLQDTTICPGEVLELDAAPEQGGGGGINISPDLNSYQWSTGETTSSIEVTEAGDYWVVVTPLIGCPVYSSAEVTVYGDENPTANIWYFGNGAGLDFNEEDGLDPPPRSITEAHAMDAPEGTSTISDANGDVLFYTDGNTVYNNLNEVMMDGDTLGGDVTSTQSVIIVPFIDDETLYYVFTTQEVYGTNEYRLKYAVIDIKEGDGLGAVTVKDQVLFTKSTEKLAAFEAGGGHWLLAHEYGNNSFRAYAITENGISPPIISSSGSVHSLNDPLSGQAGMKFSSGGDRIAVALIDGPDDYVEIFEFDVTTGEVTDLEFVIDLNEPSAANDEVYDVHFSQGDNKIFATMNNRNSGSPGGRVLEYRVDTFSTEITRRASQANIANGSGGSVNYGGIQTGPDGQIYVAIEDPGNPSATTFISAITASEDTLNASSFNLQQIALTTGNSRLGLPNFVQNSVSPTDEPSMAAPDSTCVDERIEFSAVGTSDIDQFLWTIQDSLNNVVFSALAQDTAYTFPQGQAGDFELSLNIFNRCDYDTTFVQNLLVFDIPATPQIPAALILCEGDDNLLTAGPVDPVLSYEWTNSQGTVVSSDNTFNVVEQDFYNVTITNVLGCSTSRDFFAGPPFEIELPPDITVCQNESLTLDPNVTANNYLWSINNVPVPTNNQRTIDVDTSVPGVFQYVVSIEDPITPGCFSNDTTNVTINPVPIINQTGTTPTVCGAENGGIDLFVTTSGSYTYTVFDNGAAVVPQPNNNITGPGSINITSLGAGVYSVLVRDNGSGCITTINSLEVVNSNADVSIVSGVPTTQPTCADPDGVITVTLNTGVVFPISYTLTNTSDPTAAVIIGANIPSNSAANDFLINLVPGGNYDLEVTSTGGCIATQTGILLNTPTEVGLTITSPADVCGTSLSLNDYVTTIPAAALTWVDANGDAVADPTNVTLSGIYTVTASGSGAFCDAVGILEVNLTLQPAVTINRIGDECNGTLTLEAEVTNPQTGVNYSYTWSTGEQTSQITVTTDGNYSVIVRETGVLNCPSVSVEEAVAFPAPLEAIISSTPACDDAQPITITAEVLAGTATGFSWTHNGNAIPSTTNSVVITDEGTYTVTINQGTCSIERSMRIQRIAIPEGLLPDQDFYCPTADNNPVLIAGTGFETFVWTLDGVPFNNTTNTLDVQAVGLYEVTMTTAQGCVRVDSVNIVESCEPKVILPNAFIPEGNPPNNVFFAYPNNFVGSFQIFIYTRWGELIYQSSSTDFIWDGTYAGNLVPSGTYPYVIKFTSSSEPERGEFEQSGGVLLLR